MVDPAALHRHRAGRPGGRTAEALSGLASTHEPMAWTSGEAFGENHGGSRSGDAGWPGRGPR